MSSLPAGTQNTRPKLPAKGETSQVASKRVPAKMEMETVFFQCLGLGGLAGAAAESLPGEAAEGVAGLGASPLLELRGGPFSMGFDPGNSHPTSWGTRTLFQTGSLFRSFDPRFAYYVVGKCNRYDMHSGSLNMCQKPEASLLR